MDTGFWLQRWRENRLGWHRPEVNPRLTRNLPVLGLAPGATVFVPLCGKSVDMQWLAGHGLRVIGAELSPIAVEAFFLEQGLGADVTRGVPFDVHQSGAIRVLCGDFFHLAAADVANVAAVWDRGALVAFDAAGRARYADHLLDTVPRVAAVLLVTLEYPQGIMPGPPFPVPDAEVERLFGATHRIAKLESADVLDEEPHFRERGLQYLNESVFLLRPRS